jgi:hypothetical protein
MMLYDGGMGHCRGVAPVAARHKVEAPQRERESGGDDGESGIKREKGEGGDALEHL